LILECLKFYYLKQRLTSTGFLPSLFPVKHTWKSFFSNADYVTVKEKYFDQSVRSKTIISLYEVDT